MDFDLIYTVGGFKHRFYGGHPPWPVRCRLGGCQWMNPRVMNGLNRRDFFHDQRHRRWLRRKFTPGLIHFGASFIRLLQRRLARVFRFALARDGCAVPGRNHRRCCREREAGLGFHFGRIDQPFRNRVFILPLRRRWHTGWSDDGRGISPACNYDVLFQSWQAIRSLNRFRRPSQAGKRADISAGGCQILAQALKVMAHEWTNSK